MIAVVAMLPALQCLDLTGRRAWLRSAATAPLVGAFGGAATAEEPAAGPALAQLDDGTLGLRFSYPAAWTCKGTGALESLVTGRRLTTCAPKNADASVAVLARMVPANDAYRDLENAISVDEVVEMTVPPGATTTTRPVQTFGAAKGYVIESTAGDSRTIDLFTVHPGDAGQFWAVTLTARARADRWDSHRDAFDAVLRSCAFYDPTAGL